VYTSGQVGIHADYSPPGSDYGRQARRAAENVYAAITAAGGTPSDPVRSEGCTP